MAADVGLVDCEGDARRVVADCVCGDDGAGDAECAAEVGVGKLGVDGVSVVIGARSWGFPLCVESGQKLVPPPALSWRRLDNVRPVTNSTVVTAATIAANNATQPTAKRCHGVRVGSRPRACAVRIRPLAAGTPA